jgi:hypothetical protein
MGYNLSCTPIFVPLFFLERLGMITTTKVLSLAFYSIKLRFSPAPCQQLSLGTALQMKALRSVADWKRLKPASREEADKRHLVEY